MIMKNRVHSNQVYSISEKEKIIVFTSLYVEWTISMHKSASWSKRPDALSAKEKKSFVSEYMLVRDEKW